MSNKNNGFRNKKYFNTDEETEHGFKVLMELSPFKNQDDLFKYLIFKNLEETNKNLSSPVFNLENLSLKRQDLEKEAQRNITKILLKKLKQPSNIQRLLNDLEDKGDFGKSSKKVQVQTLNSILEECRITESKEGIEVLKDFVNRSDTDLKKEFLKKCEDYKEEINKIEEGYSNRLITDKRYESK